MLNKIWLWVIIIIVVLVVVLGVWWWQKNQKSTENSQSQTSPSVTTKSSEKWVRSGKTVFEDVTSSDTHKLSDGTFRMYFMKDGKIVYAESKDAETFSDPTSTGIDADAQKILSNPAVLKIKDGEWLMVYEQQPMLPMGNQGGQQTFSEETERDLYYATSSDGKQFLKGGLVIDSSKEDNFFASVPDLVLLSDNKIRVYYVSGGKSIGSAISSDGGKNWQREIGFRLEDKAVDPDVLQKNGQWVMYFSVLSGPGNSLYKATSKDGLSWEGKINVLSAKDQQSAIVDPDVVEISSDKYRMFFGEAGEGSPDKPAPFILSYADFEGDIF